MFVEHGLAEAGGDGIDELIATQNAADVAIIEDMVGAGQAQSRSRDHHREPGRGRLLAVVDLPAAIKNIGKEMPQLGVVIAIRRNRRGRPAFRGRDYWNCFRGLGRWQGRGD